MQNPKVGYKQNQVDDNGFYLVRGGGTIKIPHGPMGRECSFYGDRWLGLEEFASFFVGIKSQEPLVGVQWWCPVVTSDKRKVYQK